jgi:chromosome segregation ATPase
MKMNAITSLAKSELTSLGVQSGGVEPVSEHAIAGLRGPLEAELSGIIDRLMTRAAAEADAAVARARATGQIELEAAHTALEEQTRRNDAVTESLLQSEIQCEELRVKLRVECDHATAARQAHETEQSARARAEAAYDEAQTVREQIVSAYESRLHAAHAELVAIRAEVAGLKEQLEADTAERARLMAAFRTVQQACAVAEPKADTPVARVQHEPSATTPGECTPENDVTEATIQTDDDRTPAPPTTSAADRRLKLVASSQAAPGAAPPHLLEYFKELFEQIDEMYRVDQRAHSSVDVVDRLSANLRYARDVFVQRASSEGLIGATLFEQELSAKLDEVSATSLGRHLAVAAYELAQAGREHVRAEAS